MRWNGIIYRIVIFLAVCGAVMSSKLSNAGMAEEPWGMPVNGLRARLTVENTVVKHGEPVVLRLEIENVGSDALTFSSYPLGVNRDWEGEALSANGEKFVAIGLDSGARQPVVTIRLGERLPMGVFSARIWADAEGKVGPLPANRYSTRVRSNIRGYPAETNQVEVTVQLNQ
jgi:hypothetical protein